MTEEEKRLLYEHPEIASSSYHKSRYKKPLKPSEMNASQLEWEIERLKSEIYQEHTNDFRGFSWNQNKALRNLMEIKAHLENLSLKTPR